MVDLNFPVYPLRIKSRENKRLVFDVVRKKYVVLHPEEWVRQHCLHFLIDDLGYPSGRMLVEREIRVSGLKKRVDIACCKPSGAIEILVECKAPQLRLNQKVFDQIARYNMEVRSDYLMVSNGIQHLYCQMDYSTQTYQFLKELPPYRPQN